MANLVQIVTITMALVHSVRPLSIEHPHSFSLFKRGVVLGDMTYSYAATDMGSSNGGRVKTVTVIKNVSIPKPTSTMFSDRTEQFFETFDLSGHKKQEQVQYWPPDDTNKMKKITIKPPTFDIPSIPKIREPPQEEFKHPAELLEIAKSAAKTQSKLLKTQNLANDDTGPVMFPPDAQMMKKKNNGVISVAKEYTSILTSTPKDWSKPKTASKLSTKVEPTKIKEFEPESYNSFDPNSMYQDDFDQTEYVYLPETKTFAFKQVSKASGEFADKIKSTPYAIKDPSPPSTIDFKLYSENDTATPDLLFSELANAVATRNVTMIKSLAGQLDEPFEFAKFNFESLKTDDYIPISFDFSPTSKKGHIMPETTTKGMKKMDISDDFVPTTENTPTPTTGKPAKYIAPRLRGFKRFSSRKQ
ncbi:uncharacterized protein LOC134210756 [Armigeres subalbatus]|uniref:uncharacterized protein LOC134210756 n=1 Tax=Armigeres subalbatus TaxID=124917 RepID=UPI002ED46012